VFVCVSTSSPQISLAVLGSNYEVKFFECWPSHRNASELILQMLDASGTDLDQVLGFIADTGPGSFTGVRVGVVACKMLAWNHSKPCAGVSSFDLVSMTETVVLPNRRGEWFVRKPNGDPELSQDPPQDCVGYGYELATERFPLAKNVCQLMPGLTWISPEQLDAAYLVSPSISVPKSAIQTVENAR
jgi:tRNA threonylcarbamoyl adenosine modification protein YeaZ